jgi:hypothetical protein
VVAYTSIMAAVHRTDDEIDRRDIDRILAREHADWIGFSFNRLRHFGYVFDTF